MRRRDYQPLSTIRQFRPSRQIKFDTRQGTVSQWPFSASIARLSLSLVATYPFHVGVLTTTRPAQRSDQKRGRRERRLSELKGSGMLKSRRLQRWGTP
jgi:hypothetical protein